MSSAAARSNPGEDTSRLIRLCIWLAAAAVAGVVAAAIATYLAIGKKVIAIGATDSGRFIPAVALDRPYLSDPRVQGLAEECLRRSFAHDFKNYRQTMTQASECYTSRASDLFSTEMQPLLQDLATRRMVMTPVIDRPPVVVSAGQFAGVHTWKLQAKVILHREGTTERVPPAAYAVELLVSRVPLEESPRGALVSFISLKPA